MDGLRRVQQLRALREQEACGDRWPDGGSVPRYCWPGGTAAGEASGGADNARGLEQATVVGVGVGVGVLARQ